MRRKLSLLLIIVLVSVAAAGCDMRESEIAAREVADEYYDAIKNQDYERASSYCSPLFFDSTYTQDNFVQQLQACK
jgi:hypothetical protein